MRRDSTDRPRAGARGWRLLAVGALIAGAMATAKGLGAGEYLGPAGLGRARLLVDGLGPLGPLAFMAAYVIGVVAFVPGLPMTLLAGLLFGPLWGTLYASTAGTIGACLAFLVARYAAREQVATWAAGSPLLSRLDRAATRQGFRLVIITRLVPIFPFNVQNYVYGITGIGFPTYALTSWLAMLPMTAVFTLAAAGLGEGGWSGRRILAGLAAAGVIVALLSLLPRWLRGRSRVLDDLAGADRG